MKPHTPTADATLSGWLLAPALAGLLALSSVIVLVGWLMTRPASLPSAAGMGEGVSHFVPLTPGPSPTRGEGGNGPGPSPATGTHEPRPSGSEEPILPAAKTFTEPIKLQRRQPTRAEEPEPLAIAEPAPAISDEKPRQRPPIRWMIEPVNARASKTDEMNLIVPVEVAKIDDGPLLYSLRRLRFPDGAPTQLRLAVTRFVYDDMANLLTKMGAGYRFVSIPNEDTYSFDKMKIYDVLFLTCSELYAKDFQAAGPLRKFVEMGGTLYASDLRGDLLQAAFPEFRAKNVILPGIQQNIDANVIDKGLQTYLGRKTVPLSFEARDWRPAAFDSNKVTVCLNGVYRNNLGQAWTVPLMVKFRVKRGTVIFTSFHNSSNDSEIVKKVLEYLVFSSINARSESRIKELMQRSQFAPQDLRPVLVSANIATESTYQHKGGGLQIALGFENLGAKLKLTLRSPTGQTIEHEDRGLYLIELPKAVPGLWRFTITPIELPFPNVPIVVAAGTTKS